MSKTKFDKKAVRQMLLEEDKFIADIFSIMPLPMHELEKRKYLPSKDDNLVKQDEMPVKKVNRAKNFEDLYTRLEELKAAKRLDYKQKLLKKKLKNKIKKKNKREERMLQKKLARTEQNAAGSSQLSTNDKETPKIPKPKPVFNSQGKMVFSKFDFSEIGMKKKLPKSNPQKILQHLQEKKEKIKQLEESGDKEKAEEIKEKDAWKAALAKANGEKVKDDSELLKRSIKRKEQKKRHSAKKWDARIENVQKSKQERQDKRRENIMKRKKEKKLNKLKKAAKKGRVIPGF
ncbi:Surfeit locus protein 6-like protein [Harpegnathos saltator]|uniref:Surfeit locus protein 6-like protein n=2 Tax=Harpegnathos saltator TaxID=610380 RepID=E2BV12_HARSA|nr:Surfeit locus protein 6-like protein [Harpegnathos saltator]